MNTIAYINSRITKPGTITAIVFIPIIYIAVFVFVSQNLGIALITLTIVIPIILIILIYPDFGYLFTFCYVGAAPFIGKHVLSQIKELQPGIIIDSIFVLVLFGYILNKEYWPTRFSFKNAILFLLIIYLIYILLLIINPYGSIPGWSLGFRIVVRQYVFIALSIFFFRNKTYFSSFTTIWFVLAFAAALYGTYQYLVGIPDFELRWAIKNETFYRFNFINGRWRIWSFLNNSTDFGMFMSSSGIFFIVYSLSIKNANLRVFYISSAVFFLIAGTFSGTRTATAIALIGFIFFALFEITNIKVIAALTISALAFIFIIFGPISNPTIGRIRSTFFPTEDASYLVREAKISRFRSYIFNHPFGGGLNALNTSGHFLNGFSPDSYYLGAFLETGILGVFLLLTILVLVISSGVKSIARISNNYPYIAMLCSFFVLTIAGYAQAGMDHFPHFVVFWGTIGYTIINKPHLNE